VFSESREKKINICGDTRASGKGESYVGMNETVSSGVVFQHEQIPTAQDVWRRKMCQKNHPKQQRLEIGGKM